MAGICPTARARFQNGVLGGKLFDLGDAVRGRHHNGWAAEGGANLLFREECLQHQGGDFKIRNDAVLDRAESEDAGGGFTQHTPRIGSECHDPV